MDRGLLGQNGQTVAWHVGVIDIVSVITRLLCTSVSTVSVISMRQSGVHTHPVSVSTIDIHVYQSYYDSSYTDASHVHKPQFIKYVYVCIQHWRLTSQLPYVEPCMKSLVSGWMLNGPWPTCIYNVAHASITAWFRLANLRVRQVREILGALFG